MNIGPVIIRELRAASRRPLNYWLRVLGAGALLAAAASLDLGRLGASDRGLQTFLFLTNTLTTAIWILVPLVTADCISEERREGTLGLLFLTPLRAHEIVTAKSMFQGLRALTASVAALPVLVLPLLMGGVRWQDALIAGVLHFNVFFLALAAGIVASSLALTRHRALVLSLVLAGCFHYLFLLLLGLTSLIILQIPGRVDTTAPMFAVAIQIGASILRNSVTVSRYGYPLGDSLSVYAATTGICFIVLGLSVVFAAVRVRSCWQEHPPSVLRRWSEATFCQPVTSKTAYQSWLQRQLERNPVGWLEQRTWHGRLVAWGWLAVMGSWCLMVLGHHRYFRGGFGEPEFLLAYVFALSMGVTGAVSFWRDREKGTLDLLLITPLSEWRIVWGRLRGIWERYLPALALFVALWVYVHLGPLFVGSGQWPYLLYFLTQTIALPLLGLCLAMSCRNLLLSVGLTLAVAVVFPRLLGFLAEAISRGEWFWPRVAVAVLFLGLLISAVSQKKGIWIGITAVLLGFWLVQMVYPAWQSGRVTMPRLLFGRGGWFGWLAWQAVWYLRPRSSSAFLQMFVLMAGQLGLAAFCAWRIHRQLKSRQLGGLRPR